MSTSYADPSEELLGKEADEFKAGDFKTQTSIESEFLFDLLS